MRLNCILRISPQTLDADVLLDPFKEDFNIPAMAVDEGYFRGREEEVVCDKSYCAWLVVYYNLSKKSELSGDVSITTEPAIEIGTTLESWPLYENFHTNGSYKVNNTKKYSKR